jgi:hypothetical protein
MTQIKATQIKATQIKATQIKATQIKATQIKATQIKVTDNECTAYIGKFILKKSKDLRLVLVIFSEQREQKYSEFFEKNKKPQIKVTDQS